MREALDALIAEMVEKGITFEEAQSEFERRFLHRVLDQAGGNQSLAARMLGMHRNTLGRKMLAYHLAYDAHAHKTLRRPSASVAASNSHHAPHREQTRR